MMSSGETTYTETRKDSKRCCFPDHSDLRGSTGSQVLAAIEVLSTLARSSKLPLSMWRSDLVSAVLKALEAAAKTEPPDAAMRLEVLCLRLLAAWMKLLTSYFRTNRSSNLSDEMQALVTRAAAAARSVLHSEADLLLSRATEAHARGEAVTEAPQQSSVSAGEDGQAPDSEVGEEEKSLHGQRDLHRGVSGEVKQGAKVESGGVSQMERAAAAILLLGASLEIGKEEDRVRCMPLFRRCKRMMQITCVDAFVQTRFAARLRTPYKQYHL